MAVGIGICCCVQRRGGERPGKLVIVLWPATATRVAAPAPKANNLRGIQFFPVALTRGPASGSRRIDRAWNLIASVLSASRLMRTLTESRGMGYLLPGDVGVGVPARFLTALQSFLKCVCDGRWMGDCGQQNNLQHYDWKAEDGRFVCNGHSSLLKLAAPETSRNMEKCSICR